ncbi:16138_t:CDS:2 [Entrophospora sp. SA101]|nr:15129_t:CDS:2 [Entrophospora sp. SA101]CAJ0751076.1 16138_t:CDS:2 [Entrophospora sp. SA101]
MVNQRKTRNNSNDNSTRRTGPWEPYEDERLLSIVKELGVKHWKLIGIKHGLRDGKQCRERWHNHLNPNLIYGPLTPKEDELILYYYSEMGTKWAVMGHLLDTSQKQQKRKKRKFKKIPLNHHQSTAITTVSTNTTNNSHNFILRTPNISVNSRYNNLEWHSRKEWMATRDSFIFSMDNRNKVINCILSRVKRSNRAIWGAQRNPCFSFDLQWFKGKCLQSSYEAKITDKEDFNIIDYEVFQVITNID